LWFLVSWIQKGGLLKVTLGRVGVSFVFSHHKCALFDSAILVLHFVLQIGSHVIKLMWMMSGVPMIAVFSLFSKSLIVSTSPHL
jgi:hypothetical protein